MNPLRFLLVLLSLVVFSQLLFAFKPVGHASPAFSEAPAGFDSQSNGMLEQPDFENAREVFEEQEDPDEGLGPLFNARSCGECHATPVVGGSSQITELRAGHFNGFSFIDHPGGSLINDRSINASIAETVLPAYEVQTFRLSSSTLGLGFVEAVDDATLLEFARNHQYKAAAGSAALRSTLRSWKRITVAESVDSDGSASTVAWFRLPPMPILMKWE